MINLLIIYGFIIYIISFFKKKQNGVLCCGLVGFSGIDNANADKLAMLMYQNSIERGKHSTGIYTPVEGVLKKAEEAIDFLKTNKIPETNLFLGHVRFATVGGKIAKNAHPFEFDNLVGIHNGTLTNHWPMLREAGYEMKDYDVDSQVLYKLLDDNSKQELDEEIIINEQQKYSTLSKFIGHAALLFTDKRFPNRLYAYRTLERPLHYGMIGESMYLSSLETSLQVIGCEDIKFFLTNRLYVIENGKIIDNIFYKEAVIPKQTYNGPYSNENDYWNNNYSNNDEDYVKNFLVNLPAITAVNNVDLVGKWLRSQSTVTIYGSNKVDIKKDNWYYCHDYNSNNAFDIIITDDSFKVVEIPKFYFDVKDIEFKEFAVCMNALTYPNSSVRVLWEDGEVVKISDLKPKGKGKDNLAIYSTKENESFIVSKKFLRPASSKEILKAKEENDILLAKFRQDIAEADNDTPITPTILENTPVIEVDENAVVDETPVVIVDNGEEEEEEELVTATAYTFVIDAVVSYIDEIKELTETTNFIELKKKVGELEELLQESYNIDKMEEWANELKEKEYAK